MTETFRCVDCGSKIAQEHLHLWQLDRDAFLHWLARTLRLTDGVRQVDERLWELGSVLLGEVTFACFFRRSGPLWHQGHQRLLAYRNALLFQALPDVQPINGFHGPCLTLAEVLRFDGGSIRAEELASFLRRGGTVRFDAESGSLFAGDVCLGDVPIGSKEFFFLSCLAEHLDRFVSYADLKHAVQQHSGSTDTTDEATFCQRLKSRTKKRIPEIDGLIVTSNKGDGYRLRGQSSIVPEQTISNGFA